MKNFIKICLAVIFFTALALYSLGVVEIPQAESVFYADGADFSGEIGNGGFNGSGEINFHNGDIFIGTLQNGRFHGQGEFILSNGRRLEAFFDNGQVYGNVFLFYGEDIVLPVTNFVD